MFDLRQGVVRRFGPYSFRSLSDKKVGDFVEWGKFYHRCDVLYI